MCDLDRFSKIQSHMDIMHYPDNFLILGPYVPLQLAGHQGSMQTFRYPTGH